MKYKSTYNEFMNNENKNLWISINSCFFSIVCTYWGKKAENSLEKDFKIELWQEVRKTFENKKKHFSDLYH